MTPHDYELDLYDAWFTPPAVVEQGLHAARGAGVSAYPGARPRVLDLGAGGGIFGQVIKRVWPDAETIGVEIRKSERSHLRRNYDRYFLGDMFRLRRRLSRLGASLVVSNPPYRVALEALVLALQVVRIGGHVLFFVRSTFGSSKSAWRRFFIEHPPIDEFSVAGRPNMRQGVSAKGHAFGGDMSPHTWLLFRRTPPMGRPRWRRTALPPLDSQDLKWTVRPGTERSLPSFPAAYLPPGA